MADVYGEVKRLLAAGKSQSQIRLELESKGFASDDVTEALAQSGRTQVEARTIEDKRNSRLVSTREVLDHVGYGGATPQFVNILFFLSQQVNPLVLPIIGLLNGFRTLISVVWSGLMQEYAKVHTVSKNAISAAGIIFGFSFLFMSFGLHVRHEWWSIWLFSFAFLIGTVGIVMYGDLYQEFVHRTLRKERMGPFLRSIARWGVMITAVTLVAVGYLLDKFPMTGMMQTVGTYTFPVYGYLVAFELTAFCFIISGYVTSLVTDRREERKYSFGKFVSEYYYLVKSKLNILTDKYVILLAFAAIITGLLQIIITAYSGIFIYQYLAKTGTEPFLKLGVIYAVAIAISFAGPWFTEKIHKSIGFAPTLVFGTLLSAIFPLVLWYNPHIATISVSLCLYIIGSAIVGFAQGVLAQKLMDSETRLAYFQTQSLLLIVPYILVIPLIAIASYYWMLPTLFLITGCAIVMLVMPLYFALVVVSQRMRL